MASSAPYVSSSLSSGAAPASHTIYGSLSSNSGHVNPLQQRAAAAAQALLAPERKVSQMEIQAMLEKNEAALRTWNVLHKQQPLKTDPMEHKEWVRRCVVIRQQIGARLELLASLADKQIAQEDEKTGEQRVSSSSTASRETATSSNSSLSGSTNTLQVPRQLSSAMPQHMYAPPQTSTISSGNSSMGLVGEPTGLTSTSMAMPNMSVQTQQNMFSGPPLATDNYQPTSSSMFYPSGQMNIMQASAAFAPATSIAVSSATASTQGFVMTSGVQAFTPNAYMASTSGPAFMNPQTFMMSGGMMNPQQQQFMPLSMPMSLASSGGGNMYGSSNFGINSAQASVSSSTGNVSNSNSNNFPVDPFINPLGFGPEANFGVPGFPMAGVNGMSTQQQHMMAMNGGNFGAQAPSMLMNNFGYGGVGMSTGPTSSQGLMAQPMPVQQFQPPPSGLQPFQQQNQLPPQQPGVGSVNMSTDSALYGDSNVNIFEGLTDDAFFPMQ